MTQQSCPWLIDFSQKDLLAAAWGSKKGADLLYHLLHRASWSAKNGKIKQEEMNDIKVQISLERALQAASISRGCYHTYLNLFVKVGYVHYQPYSKEMIVHLGAIQAAFANPPERPPVKTKQAQPKRFKMNDCTFVSIPAEEFKKMEEERFKLNLLVQSLNDSVAKLNLLVQSLNQNTTIYGTPEAGSQEISSPRDDSEYRDDSEFFPAAVESPDSTEEQSQPEEKIKKPDLRADLHERDIRDISPAEQKRIDAAEKRTHERNVRKREEELWRMAEEVAGIVVATTYAQQSIRAMARCSLPLEDIRIVMAAFAEKGRFDLTAIANYLPKYASRQKRKQAPLEEPANIFQSAAEKRAAEEERIAQAKAKRLHEQSEQLRRTLGGIRGISYDDEPVYQLRKEG